MKNKIKKLIAKGKSDREIKKIISEEGQYLVNTYVDTLKEDPETGDTDLTGAGWADLKDEEMTAAEIKEYIIEVAGESDYDIQDDRIDLYINEETTQLWLSDEREMSEEEKKLYSFNCMMTIQHLPVNLTSDEITKILK